MVQRTARIGVHNRYKYDYSCEDEYFEREMTIYEARKLPLPIPEGMKHKEYPMHDVKPLHWNDVRFDFKPENIDRRPWIHENLMNQYDYVNDHAHTIGHPDEDLDWEQPDPWEAMHYKKKRGGPVFVLGGIITVLGFILYPTCGLKMPQKDNPIYYRKKFGTASSINQQQNLAAFHYGQEMFAQGSDPVAYTEKGIVQKGNGYRIYLDNYKDMYC